MSEETAEETPTTPREPIKIGPLTPTGPRSATVGAGALGLVAVRQPLVLDALRLARAVADVDAASDTEGYLAVRAAAVRTGAARAAAVRAAAAPVASSAAQAPPSASSMRPPLRKFHT